MIPRQLKVFTSTSDELFEKKIAALALELRINDLEQFKHVYHSPKRLLNLTKDSFDQNLSFFGYSPYKNLFEDMKERKIFLTNAKSECFGIIYNHTPIDSNSKYKLINGIFWNTVGTNKPEKFYLTNKNGETEGVVLSNLSANEYLNGKKVYRFKGYVLDAKNLVTNFVAPDSSCSFSPKT